MLNFLEDRLRLARMECPVMSLRKLLTPFLTATLTCLIVLSVPDGQAEILPELSGGLAAPEPPNSLQAEQRTNVSPSGESQSVGLLGQTPFAKEVSNLPEPPNGLPYIFKQIDAGSSAVCGILANGGLMCWGLNDFGQAVPPKGKYNQVSVGQLHACAIKTNGRLKCWGEKTAFPTKLGYRGTYKKVSAGDDHTCAISGKGTVSCWGNNDYGELNVPNQKFKDISAKANHTCGITRDDALVCWGQESFVRYVHPAGRFKEVSTGTLHGCATRMDDRSVVCWGNNAYGQTNAVLGQYKSLASGDFHTCGLRTDDSLVCWGSDEHGQQQALPKTSKTIAAGGELSCGTDATDKVWCVGSYAYNPYLFQQASQLDSQNSSVGVRPQFIPFAFLGQLAAVIGGGLVNYGKGVDKSWKGAEATGVKWQLGLAAGSIIFNALSSFLPTPPSKTELLLEDIQAKLEKLQQSMDTVAKDVRQIANLVAKSYCDLQLQALQSNVDVILNANRDYQLLLAKVGTLITASVNNQALISPLADIQKFIDEQAKSISDARANIGRSMLGYVSSSPLEVCLNSAVSNFQEPRRPGADDRNFYANSYRIMNIALSAQATAQVMEQDINIYKASRILFGPIDSSVKVEPINLPPEGLAGICEIIRNPIIDPNNQRWALAKTYCDTNTVSVKEQYVEYVSEIEKLGSPYTDDFQLLTLSKELVGYGEVEKNLLWVRDANSVNLKLNHEIKSFSSQASLSSKGDIDLYSDNLGSQEGKWVPAGDEWKDLSQVFVGYSKAKGESLKYDFIESMATQKDSYNQLPLFSGVTLKPFWMSGVSFRANLNEIELKSNRGLLDGPSLEMKCFVASGINKIQLNSKNEVSGKVCAMNEFNAMNSRIGREEMGAWRVNLYGRDCGDWDGPAELTMHCVGNGSEFLRVKGSEANVFINNEYAPYVASLGDYIIRYDQFYWYSDLYYDGSFKREAAFFPGKNIALNVMPVLDVSKRQCLESLIVSSRDTRMNFKGDKKVPSRCGKDLDRVVRDLVPRPDETIPEYEDLTKYVRQLRLN